ncbi:MAG: serine protease AprX [Maribacter sp.]|jgi:serine protease AprX
MSKIYFCISIFILIFSFAATAQKQADIYVIELADKHDSKYSIHQAWEFLSPRALERRRNAGIAITETDLPVNEAYLDKITTTGARIKSTSKWLNSVLVIANENQIKAIEKLPFVVKTEGVGFYRTPKPTKIANPIPKESYKKKEDRYGLASGQIKMLQGHIVHMLGGEGEGKLVAILDGGFSNVDVMPFFDSLRVRGNLLESKDFVDNDNYAYEDISHGTQVLSTMGANLPGMMVGTAPNAAYICIKTEEMGAENPVECEYWIAGLEYADSLGADVVNSSLGYTTFDLSELSHIKSNLDGNTYRASIAASIGAKKGLLIFNSAGNEGNGKWKKIGVPADAHDIISVGAVDVREKKARFSSFGPTADGRIKPDLAAMGKRTAVASGRSYNVGTSNGTSFSSPVLAGVSTSLWSAFPDRSWNEIKEAITMSGNNYHQPDSLLGYGVPDFTKAYAQLTGIPVEYHRFDKGTRLFKDSRNSYHIIYRKGLVTSQYELLNSLGKTVLQGEQEQNKELGLLHIQLDDTIPYGVYQLVITSGERKYYVHIVHLGEGLPVHTP